MDMQIKQQVRVTIDGKPVDVDIHMTVAAALAVANTLRTRVSVSGETRFALCGMGMCMWRN